MTETRKPLSTSYVYHKTRLWLWLIVNANFRETWTKDAQTLWFGNSCYRQDQSVSLLRHSVFLIQLVESFDLIVNVHLPKDRISMAHQGYGFCEFLTEEDAEYACKIMNQIKLWGKPIRVNKVSSP